MPTADRANIIHLPRHDTLGYAAKDNPDRVRPGPAGPEPARTPGPGNPALTPHADRKRVIGDLLADYILDRAAQIQSPVTFRLAIQSLVAFWGERPASDITEATCHDYYVHRNQRRRLSNATVGRELRVLRAAINRDFDMGRLDRRVKVWIRRESAKRVHPPSRREVLLTARTAKVGSARRRYTLIAFYTGARKSAVLGLSWAQVSEKLIDFNPPGHQPTNKSRAVIPMHRKLRSFMRIWRQRSGGRGPLFQRNGRPVKTIRRAPRQLRAAAAVFMLQSGVSVYDIAKWLGNSVEMIEKHYGHYRPDHFRSALAAWDGKCPK